MKRIKSVPIILAALCLSSCGIREKHHERSYSSEPETDYSEAESSEAAELTFGQKLASLNVGDTIQIPDEGQNMYLGGNKGTRSWTLIAEDGTDRLLLCNNIVNEVSYCEGWDSCRWYQTNVHKYLNETYYYMIPTEIRKKIRETFLPDAEIEYNDDGFTSWGSDYIFIFSEDEFRKYPDAKRIIQSCYWLRTPNNFSEGGGYHTDQPIITNKGNSDCIDQYSGMSGIRPAMWITVEEEAYEYRIMED